MKILLYIFITLFVIGVAFIMIALCVNSSRYNRVLEEQEFLRRMEELKNAKQAD